MNRENKRNQGSFFLVAGFVILLFLSIPACGAIENGDFEISEPNAIGSVPTGWSTQNYARVHQSFTPTFERGQTVTWSFENNTIVPATGNNYLLLSTGDIGYDHLTSYGMASQNCFFKKDQTIRGLYFFGTGDYLGWNDYAEIRLIPTDPNNTRLRSILVEYIDVASVGDFKSTDGWQPFSYKFKQDETGEYSLEFIVYDKTDAIFKSYLAIDHVKCEYLPPAGDYNGDGTVDNLDLATFNSVLYTDCSDPNAITTYIDAAGNEMSFDVNNDKQITPEDSKPMLKYWLWNE